MQKKTRFVLNALLTVACAVAVGVYLYRALGVGPWIDIRRSISSLREGENVEVARERLLATNDRAKILDALRGALEKSGDPVAGKKALLETLLTFRELRAVERALDSSVPETRRAAAYFYHSDPERGPKAREIALEWLRDPKADSRDMAILIVKLTKMKEAAPELLQILDRPARTLAEKRLLFGAIDALTQFEPEALGPKMIAFAKDPQQDPAIRGEAVKRLRRLPNVPVDESRETLIRILTDKDQHADLRSQAAYALGGEKFAGEATLKALEQVLLDPDEKESIVQRTCLRDGLGIHASFDRLRELLKDERVYRHRYFAIRTDVADGLAQLASRDRLTLDILTEYLVDGDSDDRTRNVRQEAWLSLWTLTGLVHGVENPQLFLNPPKVSATPDRASLWSFAQIRFGVSAAMVEQVRKITPDLERMKAVRETIRNRYADIEEKWKKDAEPAPPPTPGDK